MAGFDNDVVYGTNVDFSTAGATGGSASILFDGQLLIGRTSLNAGGTHIDIGHITSLGGTIAVTNSAGTINLETVSSSSITLTGDTGGALSPTAGNFNILGGPGVTVTGSGSTLTVNSVVFSDTTAAVLVVDHGYFATAAGAYTLPATPAQGELVQICCDTSGAVVVTAPGTLLIRVGANVSSAGGTMTSTAIGDSLTLRYRTSDTTWFATSSMGNWVAA